MLNRILTLTVLIVSILLPIFSKEETPPAHLSSPVPNSNEMPQDEAITTSKTTLINGQTIHYETVTGNLVIKDEQDNPKATIFYVAYLKKNSSVSRPITFCFNGGPGSSSVWLHMGLLGPKRANYTDNNVLLPPYTYIENPHSLLDVTDLVFIDPVSTGYSKPAPGQDAKQFHGVVDDIKTAGEFIRLFITKFNKWGAPKFIAGESYGTFRAVGLIDYLNNTYYMQCNGAILISCALNLNSIDFDQFTDLPYVLFLPSYAASAWYHERLSPEIQKKPLDEHLFNVERFATTRYNLALMQGDKLDSQEKIEIAKQLESLTGISQEHWIKNNLRIQDIPFLISLLEDQNRVIGRFDSRYSLSKTENQIGWDGLDPSSNMLFRSYTSALNQYLPEQLAWRRDQPYKILANVYPWRWTNKTSDSFLYTMSDSMSAIMKRNPYFKCFVASGYYDLATPYFATEHFFDHLGLDQRQQARIIRRYYEAGHMMYVNENCASKLSEDLRQFIQKALKLDKTDVYSEITPVGKQHSLDTTCDVSSEIP